LSYLGNKPAGGTITNQFFTGDGSTTAFALNHEYGNEASVLVFLSGVKQKSDSYGVTNGFITFGQAPGNTVEVEIIYLGGSVITTPYLAADTYGVVRINATELTTNTSITTGYNASSAGPLKVANSVTVTVATGSSWTIF
jgi:hypothetical protein